MDLSQKHGRIRHLMDRLRLNQMLLAEATGLRQNTVSNICTGKKKELPESLIEFFSGKGFNIHWLLTGEGQEIQQSQKPGIIESIHIEISDRDIEMRKEIQFLKSRIDTIANELEKVRQDGRSNTEDIDTITKSVELFKIRKSN